MAKRVFWGGLAVFVAWGVLDFVVHGIILKSAYEATASLWRPMNQMKLGVMYLAGFIAAMAFSALYGWFVGGKTISKAVKFGVVYGIAVGVGMGYGTYSVMPIPYFMALTWFLATVFEAAIGGLLLGLIVREE